MQTQTNKSIKKAAKRRNRNKRRRKLRQQRKLQTIHGEIPPPSRKVQQQSPQKQTERWEALCLETFQRLTTWQSEAELNFWKARTEYLQNENKLLKQELESVKREAEEKVIEEQDVDPGYLEFIAITHRHREELSRARACKGESVAGLE